MNKLIWTFNILLLFAVLIVIGTAEGAAPKKPGKCCPNECKNLAQNTGNSQTAKDSVKTAKNCKDSASCKKHLKKHMGNDCFIDEDGDGINDHRCQGSGLCKQKRNKKCCPRK